jgi:hypothetical protein
MKKGFFLFVPLSPICKSSLAKKNHKKINTFFIANVLLRGCKSQLASFACFILAALPERGNKTLTALPERGFGLAVRLKTHRLGVTFLPLCLFGEIKLVPLLYIAHSAKTLFTNNKKRKMPPPKRGLGFLFFVIRCPLLVKSFLDIKKYQNNKHFFL